jgi:hypothetical protein
MSGFEDGFPYTDVDQDLPLRPIPKGDSDD